MCSRWVLTELKMFNVNNFSLIRGQSCWFMPFSKISHTRKVHPYIPDHVVMRWDGNDKWIDESEVYLQVPSYKVGCLI